jgi:citrate lyase beta subunit
MLGPQFADHLDRLLGADDAAREQRHGSGLARRQPVHTAYVPADELAADTAQRWGAAALAALAQFGPVPGASPEVTELVAAKLAAEPVEDLRIDFEDGYGARDDAEEDRDVRSAAACLAAGAGAGAGTPFLGLRMKSLGGPTRRRGIRTLDLFLSELLSQGPLPAGFRVTLPKVTSVAQVAAMSELCAALEAGYGLPPATLRFELQVETPEAVLGPDGTALVAPMITAAGGRCAGLHYGTYDYSAALGIAAAYQSMEHPAADHAKAVMQVAAAGAGIPVCDGSTNVLPVGDRSAVQAAWALQARLIRRSLERGYYQGWDLHPAQLPARYAATFAFYRDGLPDAAGRLRDYLAHRQGGVLDEPATAAALAGFLVRGLDAGAVGAAEAAALTGVSRAELARLARPAG